MSKETHYFISDIHFCSSRPDHLEAFIKLCAAPKAGDKVILLGDIFEVWTGDDTTGKIEQAIESCLFDLSCRGVKTFFMHGNRDFLVGRRFCERTKCELLPDPFIWQLPNGTKCLLTHGDIFCTHDKKYKKFRSITRNKLIQWLFLRLPKKRRSSIAGSLRSASKKSQASKSTMLLDAHEPLVNDFLNTYSPINIIIMGHTHRPNIHVSNNGYRVVLGDWSDTIWYGVSNKTNTFELYECETDLSGLVLRHSLNKSN